MGHKRPSYPRRGKVIITRMHIAGLDMPIVVVGGEKLFGWKSCVREQLQRESERLQRNAAISMQLQSESYQNTSETDAMFSKQTADTAPDFRMEDCEPQELLWTEAESEWMSNVWQTGKDAGLELGF